MNLLLCSNPLNPKAVDFDWQDEYNLAKQQAMNIVLFDYETFERAPSTKSFYTPHKPSEPELIVYRGWMMPVVQYQKLYEVLLTLNFRLINTPEEYQHCYYFPDSYDKIAKRTPKSVFIEQQTLPSDEALTDLLSVFGNQPIIVKDYVKSQKHYWYEACFIPDASVLSHVKHVVSTFIDKQGSHFQGGLVFREFVKLEPVGIHPKSNMPLTREYRVFVLNHQPLTCSEYWDEGEYEVTNDLDLSVFKEVFASVDSPFFTVDIAKQSNGKWIIIELGDGQVAEYLGTKELETFYHALSEL